MSYRMKTKKFKCLLCKTSFSKLVSEDEISVNCENCGKSGNEENKKEEEEVPIQERRRFNLVNGAYRIVFNQENSNNFHTRTNVRDRSIDNFHGDAAFIPQRANNSNDPLIQNHGTNMFRTPGHRSSKFDENSYQQQQQQNFSNTMNSRGGINPLRPPSGMNSNPANRNVNREGPQMNSQSNTNPFQSRVDTRNSQRQQASQNQNNFSQRPPSGMFQQRQTDSRGGPNMRNENVRISSNFQPNSNNTQSNARSQAQENPYQGMRQSQQNFNQNNQQQQREPRMQSQAPRQNPHQQIPGQNGQSGMRTRSTVFRTNNGNVLHIIQFGSGDQNDQRPGVNEFGIPPPNFMFMRGGQPQNQGIPDMNNIGDMLTNIFSNFSNLFSGQQFMRMNNTFQGFSPDVFMTNFNSNFFSDQDFLEMARRMSEQEAAAQARKRRAQQESVSKLPIVKIEMKHCKKGSQGTLEPPTCTVCCENISIGLKGMFMPCGHIYHPDCLNPWLKEHNTCPVCRFELPTEEQ